MPLLQAKKVDGKLVIDQEVAEELRQRSPDWSRQAFLTRYLLAVKRHKFPPLLVTVADSWVDDENASEWGADGRATCNSMRVEPMNSDGSLCTVNFSSEPSVYALDGQHRKMGIDGVINLQMNGFLEIKKKDGTTTERLSREKVLKDSFITLKDLQRIPHERIEIELMPAVLEGETREEARQRIRTIFVHVNKMARRLTPGQMALLEEDDGFAIVARRVATSHPFFNFGGVERINWSSNSLPARSNWVTTLETLTRMAERYLGPHPEFDDWYAPKKGEIPIRPEEAALSEGADKFRTLIDLERGLPSFMDVQTGMAKIDEYREFDAKQKGARGHLMFRPIGQIILAQAVGVLQSKGADLDSLQKKLEKYDKAGGFEVGTPNKVWWGVTYEPTGTRMITSGVNLGADLLKHLLGDGDPESHKSLRGRFAEARTIDEGTGKVSFSWDGKKVKPEDVQLPPMI